MMRRSTKIVMICLAIVVTVLLSLPALIPMVQEAAQRRQLVEELKRQGIYELAFYPGGSGSPSQAIYMVCEPPGDRQQLAEQIDCFLTEQDIVPKLIQRAKEKMESLGHHYLPYQGMWLIFLEPYSELRIGDFPKDLEESCPAYGAHILRFGVVKYPRDAFYIPEPDFEMEWSSIKR